MIERLRRRFVAVAMGATAAVLLLMCIGINVVVVADANADADRTLAQLAAGEGPAALGTPGGRGEKPSESAFGFRYLKVWISESGVLVSSDLSRVSTVTAEDLEPFVEKAEQVAEGYGDYGDYRYLVESDGSGRLAVFLERGLELKRLHSIAGASVLVSLAALALVFALVWGFSYRAIDPLVQNLLEQRRFVTDASHELKTPLTVIGTCLSLIEMEQGDSPWTEKAQRQVESMGGLVNDLVFLSRMDEGEAPAAPVEFDAAAAVRDVAQSFEDGSGGARLQVVAPASVPHKGDEYALRKLCGILLDNAFKYAPAGTPVTLGVERKGSALVLWEKNALAPDSGVGEEQLGRLFDRFWRPDSARSEETGGSGIGLAIAKSICEARGGSIKAELADGGASIRFEAQMKG